MAKDKSKKSDIADAAFKKKVTIINGCILLAFIVGLVAFLGYTMSQEKSYPERFQAEIDSAIEAAKAADSDKSVIDINITDETYIDWIMALSYSYGQNYHTHDGDGEIVEHEVDEAKYPYACFEGNTVKLKGVFKIVPIGTDSEEYWVYRKYLDVNGGENTISIEVQFDGEEFKEGDWVEVVGTVSSENGFSCIKDATVTLLDSKDKKEFVK